jgi:hypothetical protein
MLTTTFVPSTLDICSTDAVGQSLQGALMIDFRHALCAWIIACLSLLGAHSTFANELSLSLSIPGASRQATNLNLTWSDTKYGRNQDSSGLCVATATLIYTTASHPGGNKHGILNERVGGRGGRCYINDYVFIDVAALMNSQYGNTFAFGPGVQFRLFQLSRAFGGISLDLGAEIPYVHYEYGAYLGQYLRARGRVVNAPLPMLFASLNWQIGKVEMGMMQLKLPAGVANLRAAVIKGSFNELPPSSSWNQNPGQSSTSPNGPSFFINYTFTDLFGL